VNGPVILSPWFVLPVAAVMMLAVAAHITVTEKSAQPRSRRRIRIANGWVMLVGVPLIAAGFSIISPEVNRRAFVLVWLMVMGLVLISLGLAGLDILNTMRLTLRDRRRLREGLRDLHVEAAGGRAAASESDARP